MAYGMNLVILVGHLGRDVEIRHTRSGGKVANLNLATDESYIDKQSGQKVDKAEWHRIVTFQEGVIDMLAKHATKGRKVQVTGKLQTNKWQDQNGNDRYTTEVLIAPGSPMSPGGSIQFLDKPDNASTAGATAMPANDPGAPASVAGHMAA